MKNTIKDLADKLAIKIETVCDDSKLLETNKVFYLRNAVDIIKIFLESDYYKQNQEDLIDKAFESIKELKG
jgi:hypothetical protein